MASDILSTFGTALHEAHGRVLAAHEASIGTLEAELQHMRNENSSLRARLTEYAMGEQRASCEDLATEPPAPRVGKQAGQCEAYGSPDAVDDLPGFNASVAFVRASPSTLISNAQLQLASQDEPVPEAESDLDSTAAPVSAGAGPSCDAQSLTPHARVRVHGLVSAQELNDRTGTLERFDVSSGRWQVQLEAGGLKALKPENLIAIEEVDADRDSILKPSDGGTPLQAAGDSVVLIEEVFDEHCEVLDAGVQGGAQAPGAVSEVSHLPISHRLVGQAFTEPGVAHELAECASSGQPPSGSVSPAKIVAVSGGGDYEPGHRSIHSIASSFGMPSPGPVVAPASEQRPAPSPQLGANVATAGLVPGAVAAAAPAVSATFSPGVMPASSTPSSQAGAHAGVHAGSLTGSCGAAMPASSTPTTFSPCVMTPPGISFERISMPESVAAVTAATAPAAADDAQHGQVSPRPAQVPAADTIAQNLQTQPQAVTHSNAMTKPSETLDVQPGDAGTSPGLSTSPASPQQVAPKVTQDVGTALESVLTHFGWRHLGIQKQTDDVWNISGIPFHLRVNGPGKRGGPPFELLASTNGGSIWEPLDTIIRKRRLQKQVRAVPGAVEVREFSTDPFAVPAEGLTYAVPLSLADLANMPVGASRGGLAAPSPAERGPSPGRWGQAAGAARPPGDYDHHRAAGVPAFSTSFPGRAGAAGTQDQYYSQFRPGGTSTGRYR